jgi:hypothetical protein
VLLRIPQVAQLITRPTEILKFHVLDTLVELSTATR